ncbi:transporter (NhaC family) [Planomicrobium soli]|uniref:Transporter (NhaC family) n=1 Tax=Planomicrobium soli TaxID=1176648 RepID=A0A2P8H3D3_9BACL|nr:Na+/H+ antiporter NhaC [Planomicrobium soli]PSL40734.1 transporter (NhaC family) [Planomicrobium soli]
MNATLAPWKAVTLIAVSIAIIFGGIIFIDAESTIVLLAAGTALIILSLLWGIKWDAIEKDLMENLRAMFTPILILLAVGLMIGIWMLAGTIPVIVYYGLLLIKPSVFLFVACLACALMSVMAGTSWGTIGTIGVAFMGVSVGLDIPLQYTAGAVVVGALFGDKMSPLSDTTVMAAAVTDVKLVDHIKHMLYTTVPGLVISLILFLFLGFRVSGQVENEQITSILNTLETNFNLNPLLLLPPFVILFLIYKNKPTLPVFGVGILLGALLAIIFQGNGLAEIAVALNDGYTASTGVEVVDRMLQRGGLSSMLGTVALLIAAAIFGSPLRTAGVIDVILNGIQRVVKTGKGIMLSSLSLHSFLFIITGSYYVTFAVLGPMMKSMYDQYGLHRKNFSRTLEDTGTALAPLIPWSVTGAFIAGTLGVPTLQYAPFAPMLYLGIVFAIIYILTGFGIAKVDSPATEKEKPVAAKKALQS